ncbi:MAG: hypothetical protein LBK58_08940 [Prevotellaceae bacterium]|nr:hypothetical protein [Prevotellaceae bacterium]
MEVKIDEYSNNKEYVYFFQDIREVIFGFLRLIRRFICRQFGTLDSKIRIVGDLPTGDYKLSITIQYGKGTELLKKPRTYTFDYVLVV